MTNLDIRKAIASKFLRHWQIAERMGVAEETLSRWMRHELTPERRQQVFEAIEKLSKESVVNG